MEEVPHLLSSVQSLMVNAKSALSEIFDIFTVSEWIEQKLYPLYKKLNTLQNRAQKLRNRKTWPVRPNRPIKELSMFSTIPPSTTVIAEEVTGRPKRRVQAPDYYLNRKRQS